MDPKICKPITDCSQPYLDVIREHNWLKIQKSVNNNDQSKGIKFKLWFYSGFWIFRPLTWFFLDIFRVIKIFKDLKKYFRIFTNINPIRCAFMLLGVYT